MESWEARGRTPSNYRTVRSGLSEKSLEDLRRGRDLVLLMSHPPANWVTCEAEVRRG